MIQGHQLNPGKICSYLFHQIAITSPELDPEALSEGEVMCVVAGGQGETPGKLKSTEMEVFISVELN